MSQNDHELLNDYLVHRSEESFRLLVERYSGLVFHTAMRRMGNRAQAEDVSQTVLCLLARKAGELRSKSDRLGPWLHRATLYEASKLLRSEKSQQRRAVQLQTMEEPNHEESSAEIIEAIPHLDEALNKLPDSDRKVLLLHFFDKLTFSKIAPLVGKSPAATQKQSRRALEKLSTILQRKGVTISTLTIATALTAEMAKAAPSHLIPSLCQSAVSGAATSATGAFSGFMGIQISKTVLASSVALIAIPIGLQQKRIIDAKSTHLAEQEQKIVQVRNRPDNSKSSLQVILQNDVRELAKTYLEALKSGDSEKIEEIKTRLVGLDELELAQLLSEASSTLLMKKEQEFFLPFLIKILHGKNPSLVVRTIAEACLKDSTQDFRLMTQASMEAWIEQDPFAVQAWLIEQEEIMELRAIHGKRSVDQKADLAVRSKLLVRHFLKDLSQAEQLITQTRAAEREELMEILVQHGSLDLDGSTAPILLRWTNEHLDRDQRQKIIPILTKRYASVPGERLAAFRVLYDQHSFTAEDRDTFIEAGAKYVLQMRPLSKPGTIFWSPIEREPFTPTMAKTFYGWLQDESPSKAATIFAEALAENGSPEHYLKIEQLVNGMEDQTWLPAFLDKSLHRSMARFPESRQSLKNMSALLPERSEQERYFKAFSKWNHFK